VAITRAYELMIIVDGDTADSDVPSIITRIEAAITEEGGRVASTDNWGRRRFAYEIDHKHEGVYVVWEIVTEAPGLPGVERQLRLADEIVRHKLFRLPDHEAARRGLLGEAAPASAG
jgi:small subunit ribosomal protein S6